VVKAARVKALRRHGLDLLERARAALHQAEAEQNWPARLGAMRELRETLGLLGKLFGGIGAPSRVSTLRVVNIEVVYEDHPRDAAGGAP
jgi:hypothetical protein